MPVICLGLLAASCAAQSPQRPSPGAPAVTYSRDTSVAAFAQAQQLSPLDDTARDPDLLTPLQMTAPNTAVSYQERSSFRRAPSAAAS